MFYVDFTSPEGKTYRIDLSKHPVKYNCPNCGRLLEIQFEPDEETWWCDECSEEKVQKKQEIIPTEPYVNAYGITVIPPRIPSKNRQSN